MIFLRRFEEKGSAAMKKIGIVTIIDYYNYGNRLQNYAVTFVLSRLLHCKAITLEGYKTSKLGDITLLNWVKEQVALFLCRFPGPISYKLNPSAKRWFNFSYWSKKWIPRRRFFKCDQLPTKLNKEFDIFIAGSDQIWNNRIQNIRLQDFLLSFAEKGKKNALSASFGVEELTDKEKFYYSPLLSEFSNISVREDTGAKIVKDLTGREVPVLIDPVMMLNAEDWVNVENEPDVEISTPYVLKYFLGSDESNIDIWAANNGFLVYDLMNRDNGKLYTCGPGEFISLVRHAALICSDSFHCIAFSIIFSVPFIVYERNGKEDYMLSRMRTLLGKFGLNNRWNYMLDSQDYLKCDFRKANTQLDIEKSRFIEYVTKVVND